MLDKALKALSPRLGEAGGGMPPKVGPRPREAFPNARALWLGVRGLVQGSMAMPTMGWSEATAPIRRAWPLLRLTSYRRESRRPWRVVTR